MDADTPKTSINLAQHELDKARAQWAAEKERRIAENDDLNKIQPGPGEKANARWQGEGGRLADEGRDPLPLIHPDPTRS
jgi:hypothetical protein